MLLSCAKSSLFPQVTMWIKNLVQQTLCDVTGVGRGTAGVYTVYWARVHVRRVEMFTIFLAKHTVKY